MVEDELEDKLTNADIEEIGISYAGTPAYATEMKERLQKFVEKSISQKLGRLFKRILAKMLGQF